jgi:hypothetical protein
MTNNNTTRFFSNTQLFITALLAGPLPAGYLLSHNCQNVSDIRSARFARFFGYLGTLAVIILTLFISETILFAETPVQKGSPAGYSFEFLILLAFQSLLALLVLYFNKRTLSKSNSKIERYPVKKIIGWFLTGLVIIFSFLLLREFVFFVLIVYVLPNLYLHSRIKKAFMPGRQRAFFTSIFALIVLLFPLGMFAQAGIGHVLLRYARFGGYYFLPVLLYTFLLYLLFDLVRVFNWKGRFISKSVLVSRKFNAIVFLAIMVISSSIVVTGAYNFNHPQINKYRISVPAKSSKADHLKIAMTADIHLSEITSKRFVKRLVNKVNSINADIILLPGDIIEGDKSNPKAEYFEKQFTKLQSKYGVYAADGNHEIYMGNKKFDFFEDAEIEVLRDTVIRIDDSFYLIGRRDVHDKRRRPFEDLSNQLTDSFPTFLLDHQPSEFETAYENNIDVQFSGHTHNGQMFPFQYITRAIYELSWGYTKIQNTHFFVTSGAQGWGPPVKTSAPSEIMEIDVYFEEE